MLLDQHLGFSERLRGLAKINGIGSASIAIRFSPLKDRLPINPNTISITVSTYK